MMMHLPTSLDEALAVLDATDAVPVAGGTDLFVRWPEKVSFHERSLLDLSGIAELRVSALHSDHLRLGATATYWDFLMDAALRAEFPMLATAARQVGAVQIQTRGTWAGNVVNASPAADGVLALMACDAAVEVRSRTEQRTIPLRDFYTGYRATQLRRGEMVTAVLVPRELRTNEYLEKVGSRRAQTISKVGLATCRVGDAWRVTVNAMAPTVRRCPTLERAMTSTPLETIDEWLPLIRADLAPIDDVRSTRDYREQVLARLLHALTTQAQ